MQRKNCMRINQMWKNQLKDQFQKIKPTLRSQFSPQRYKRIPQNHTINARLFQTTTKTRPLLITSHHASVLRHCGLVLGVSHFLICLTSLSFLLSLSIECVSPRSVFLPLFVYLLVAFGTLLPSSSLGFFT